MNFTAYYRVSTTKQGTSGLGLEAQRKAVKEYVESKGGSLLDEFTEIESGKKCSQNRPELNQALKHCKKNNSVLIIAKLDRLSRDLEFIAKLQNSNLKFICADMPEANELTIGMMAVLAQYERKMISKRTKDALAAAKARGVKLGGNIQNLKMGSELSRKAAKDFADKMKPVIKPMLENGLSQREIASRLNSSGVQSFAGRAWHQTTISRIVKRIN